VNLVRWRFVLAAAAAAAAGGWLLDGRIDWLAAGVAGFDWAVASLFLRISDVPDDERKGVPGTDYVRRNAGMLMRAAFIALGVSLFGLRPLGWPLLGVRLAFHAVGFAYAFPTVVPRLKEVPGARWAVPVLLLAVSAVGVPLALR